MAKINQILTVVAMFISAGAIALPDTSPMSARTIAVASSGVMLAVAVLLQAIGINDAISKFGDVVKGVLDGHDLEDVIEIFVDKLTAKKNAQANQPASKPASS
jgi:hypothetical protein